MTHLYFALAAVCYIASLVVFAVMVTDLPRKHEFLWLVAWLGPAIAYIVLIFPATAVSRRPTSSNGFGNPGHLLGWLFGGAAVYVVMLLVIFTIVTRLPSIKKRAKAHR